MMKHVRDVKIIYQVKNAFYISLLVMDLACENESIQKKKELEKTVMETEK